MGTPTALIQRVETPTYGHVVIDASEGRRYEADLTSMAAVCCFPRDDASWRAVAPDSAGLALVWTSRFEVHVDQVLLLANRVETKRRTA